ncbi:MAG: TolC family protein [Pseudomonadota bacterium]|nr:TolC family protein [Pseudomonadota bacterium]
MSRVNFISPSASLARCLFAILLVLAATPSSAGMDLHDAIRVAFNGNYEYLQVLDKVKKSDMTLDVARSAFRTHFNASLRSDTVIGADIGQQYRMSLSRKLNDGSRVEAGVYASQFDSSALSEFRVQYTRPLFSDPERSGVLALNIAESDRKHSLRVSEVGAEELTARVIQAWYRAYQAGQGIAVQQAALVAADRLVAAVNARYANDLASRFDVEQAELNASLSRQTVKDAEVLLQNDLDKLKVLLGLNPENNADFDFSLLTDQQVSPVSDEVDVLQQMALNHRLEIIAMKESRDYALQRMNIINKRVGPPVDLSIHYALVGQGDSLDDTFAVDDRRIGVGLNVSTDFALATEKNQARLAVLEYEQSERSYRHFTATVKTEIRSAVRQKSRYEEKALLARKTAELGEKRFVLAKKRYDDGQIDVIELLESQRDLARLRQSSLTAIIDLQLARLNLDLISGQLRDKWQLPQANQM